MQKVTHLSFRQHFALFLVSFALLFAGFAVSAWTGPTATPPDGNVSAPINVGGDTQIKSGSLWATSMGTDGGYCIGASCITAWPSAGSGFTGSGSSNYITKFTGATALGNSSLLYDNGTNVGISTANPSNKFDVMVGTNTNDGIRVSTSDSGSLLMARGGPSAGQFIIGSFDYPSSLRFLTNSVDRVVITGGGQVGIGTVSPTGLLHVGSGSPVSPRLGPIDGGYITVADNPYGYSIIAGRILATTYFNSDSYWLAGTCWNAYGGCPSDVRLKDHIRPFEPGLSAILNINPVYYRYNGLGGTPKSDHDVLGVLAQDVEIGAPELVQTERVKLHVDDTNETDIKKLDNSGLPYLLINAVKELYERWSGDSKELRAQLAAQQTEIDALKKELEILKSK